MNEELKTAIDAMEAEQLQALLDYINGKLKEEPAEGEEREDGEGVEAPVPETVPEEVIAAVQEVAGDLERLEEIVEAVEGRKSTIKEKAAKRSKLIERIAQNKDVKVIRKFEEEKKMPEFDEKLEYRNAWLNKIRGVSLTEAQQRAYSNTTNNGAEVVPQELQNDILTKIKTLAPMLGEITLLHVNGMVRYAVEGTNNAAVIHTENQAMNPAADTLAQITLGAYEITKLVQISDTVRTMSISSFATWITDRLAEAIARKLEDEIINGDGDGDPTGVEKANTWVDNTNQITVGAAASLTAANVQALIGLLNAGYDAKAKFVMSKRTLFTDFMPLQDNSKNKIVSVEGRNYYIYGYPVLLSDYVTHHISYLGDFTKMVGNLGEDINVHNDYDIKTNSYYYSGVAIFDCKPGLGEAFVKLNKASE